MRGSIGGSGFVGEVDDTMGGGSGGSFESGFVGEVGTMDGESDGGSGGFLVLQFCKQQIVASINP